MNKSIKIILILAVIFLALGGILFTVTMSKLNWDFNVLDTNKYQTNTYEITENFESISLNTNTTDVSFIPTQLDTATVVCFEKESETHNVTVLDGVLTVTYNQSSFLKKLSFFNFKKPNITISLPQAEYNDLIIVGDTSDITLTNELTFSNVNVTINTGDVTVNSTIKENLKISTTTGDITIYDTSVNNADLSVTTGDIGIAKLNCTNDLKISVTTGDSKLNDVQCKNLISTGDTGDLELNNVIASEKFIIDRDTGDVDAKSCDASEIQVTTDTGDVEMTLLSSKIFVVETDTGRKRVPISTNGGLCQVTTDTGDIEIYIKE
jgi:DUF4097 and DUF4098 domain-containing protein YvlB